MDKSDSKSLVKLEGNIAEYPFFSFAKSEGKIEKKVYKFSSIVLDDGKIEKRTLTLESPKEWGLPLAFDMDVLIAVSQIGTETNTLTDEIHLTLYEIAKKLDIPNRELKISESLLRMYYVNCHSEYCILVIDKKGKEKKYLTKKDYFHIFESVGLLDVEREQNRRKSRENTYVQFNRYFIQNFLSGYFQYINCSIYMSLETPTAKRLYLYLSKKRFGRTEFKISITKLANVIPITAKRITEIRRILKEASERLINQNVISGYQLEKGAMDITFYFPAQEIKGDDVPLLEGKDSTDSTRVLTTDVPINDNVVYEELINKGVSKGVAKQLITKYPADTIRHQIEWIKYREFKDPAAMLVSAIKDDWAAPKEVLDVEQKREEEKAKETMEKRIKNAKYIIFPSGERCKISRMFPNSEAIEYFIDEKKKCVILFNKALDCRFE